MRRRQQNSPGSVADMWCQAAGVIAPRPPDKPAALCPEGIVFGLPGDKATVSSISLRRIAQKPHPLTYIFLLKF